MDSFRDCLPETVTAPQICLLIFLGLIRYAYINGYYIRIERGGIALIIIIAILAISNICLWVSQIVVLKRLIQLAELLKKENKYDNKGP